MIEPNTLWRHKRTGYLYHLLSAGDMKVADGWTGCVTYQNNNGYIFTREKFDFLEKFEQVQQ